MAGRNPNTKYNRHGVPEFKGAVHNRFDLQTLASGTTSTSNPVNPGRYKLTGSAAASEDIADIIHMPSASDYAGSEWMFTIDALDGSSWTVTSSADSGNAIKKRESATVVYEGTSLAMTGTSLANVAFTIKSDGKYFHVTEFEGSGSVA